MANDEKREFRFMATHFVRVAELIQANEAALVVIPPDVLAQGSEAQAPAEAAPPEPTPPTPNAGTGKSGNNPDLRKQNHQAPSASE